MKMPAKSTKKATEKKDGTALQEAEKSDEAGLALQVSTALSPETGKVVESLTANITRMIDSKLELILKKIQDVSKEVQHTNKRVKEADQRILVLENVATGAES